MIEGIPRISVRVITYKQEKLIKRALDSLLAQKDYIYEICVSDDCSPDGTWEVLKEYAEANPGLFVLNRNEKNLGIFANIEKTWDMASGDMVFSIAGDDEAGSGWLKSVVEYVISNNIDYRNEFVTIYGDYEARYPNGDSFVFSNSAILSGIDPLRLSIRGIIGNRSAVCSKKVIKSFVKVSQGKSHIAESAIDRQLPLFSKKVYYIPWIGNIYYARIGVSASIQGNTRKERENIETYAMQMMRDNGYDVTKEDAAYMQLRDEKGRSYRNKSISHYFKILKLHLASFDPKVSFKAFRLKRYVFALRLRLPHSKPFRMNV